MYFRAKNWKKKSIKIFSMFSEILNISNISMSPNSPVSFSNNT